MFSMSRLLLYNGYPKYNKVSKGSLKSLKCPCRSEMEPDILTKSLDAQWTLKICRLYFKILKGATWLFPFVMMCPKILVNRVQLALE